MIQHAHLHAIERPHLAGGMIAVLPMRHLILNE